MASSAPRLRPVSALSTAVSLLLGVAALLLVGAAFTKLAYANAVDDFVAAPNFSNIEAADDADTTQAVFVLLSLGAMLVTGVVVLVWQVRCREVAAQLGAGGQRWSNALAVGCWFIPFASYVMPKMVINDLYRASDPSIAEGFGVAGRPVAGVVNAWWIFWVLGATGFASGIQGDDVSFDNVEEFASQARVEAVASFLLIVAAVLGVVVVQRITQRLRARAQLFGMTLD